MRAVAALALIGLLLLFASLALRNGPAPVEPNTSLQVASLLGDPQLPEGFARATRAGAIRLPADHGAHPDYQSEWWYFTGNLESEGRRFAFQLTFFRFATAPTAAARESVWVGNQLYMAHFAISDVSGSEHRVAERFARVGADLAGVATAPFAVWLDDWRVESLAANFLPLRLRARDAATGLSLDLQLDAGKPVVMQGDAGLSVKGPEAGNASYYYSYTRLPARGELAMDGNNFTVRGNAWLDHEWSSSSLGPEVQGWDWFGLQLNDGRELMLYALRDDRGQASKFSTAMLVAADGSYRAFGADQFSLRALRFWKSPSSGASWPLAWRIELPDAALDLEVTAMLDDQEQALSVLYWEGAVDVKARNDRALRGRGFMELTGYLASDD
jgi:predicted secreted hydrolase